jgi:energy-coupling factor transporter transmembrane protein EcfT
VARLGPAASLDPACRLLCLALVSSAALLGGPLLSLVLVLLFTLLLFWARLRPVALLREAAIVGLFALFSAALRLVGLADAWTKPWEVLGESAGYGLRLLAAFLGGRLFYASTSASELRDATTRLCRKVPMVKRLDLGLVLSLILGFIPLIFEEWNSSLEAARSRGLARRPSLHRQALFMTAFLRRLMLRAVATPEALLARGLTRDRGLAPSAWKRRDSLISVGFAALLVAAALHAV